MQGELPKTSQELVLVARVGKINGVGSGRFAVTYPVDPPSIIGDRDITFSLDEAWSDHFDPQPGQLVELSALRKFSRGWRALRADPVRLSQES